MKNYLSLLIATLALVAAAALFGYRMHHNPASIANSNLPKNPAVLGTLVAATPNSIIITPQNSSPRTFSISTSTQVITQVAAGVVLGTSTTDGVVTQSQMQAAIDQASNTLRQLIYANAGTVGQGQYSTGGYTNNIALSNRIDQLSGTTLTNVVVNGVSGLKTGDIPDLSSQYLPLSGGTITGGLTVTGSFSGGNLSLNAASSTNSLSINATSTNLFATNATSTTLFTTTITGTNATFTNATTTKLAVTGSSYFAGFINTDQYSGYKQAGDTVLYASTTNNSFAVDANAAAAWMAASSTNWEDVAMGPGALATSPTTGLATRNVGIGYFALNANTTGYNNTAVGALAGAANTTGFHNTSLGFLAASAVTTGHDNTALGEGALGLCISCSDSVAIGPNTLLSASNTGTNNIAIGENSMIINTTGSNSVSIGSASLYNATTGQNNVGIGYETFYTLTSASNNTALGTQALFSTNGADNVAIGGGAAFGSVGGSNVAIGYQALFGASNDENTAIGAFAGSSATTGAFNNTLLGALAGYNISSGSGNVLIGASPSNLNNLTTGSNNISLGFDISLPSATASNQLDIGNLIYGTGINGTGATLSTGNVGIGTTTPYSRLTVWGSDTASSTAAFTISNSASTTEFSVFDGGNAQLAGTLTQNSDQRLKTNIRSIDASSSLVAIDALNPVTFNWIDPTEGTAPQLGFIAQQVQQVFPILVSTTSATALTPDGTLGLNYLGLIAPLVEAVQALSAEVQSLTTTVAGFASSFTTHHLKADDLCLSKSDGSQVCVTGDQLGAFLSGQSQPSVSISNPTPPTISGTTTPPSIDIQGSNPATINVGDTYTDLGAIVHDSQGHDLSYRTFINGVLSGNILIDTSQAATDTIDYVATDTWGNTATSTRTVVIEAVASSTSI